MANNIQKYTDSLVVKEVLDDRPETVTVTVRLTKEDKAYLTKLARENRFFFKGAPNLSKAARKVIQEADDARGAVRLAKALEAIRQFSGVNEELTYEALNVIQETAGQQAQAEVLEKIISGEVGRRLDKELELTGWSNTNAGLTPTPVGEPSTKVTREQLYQTYYKTWFEALSGYSPEERERLSRENAQLDLDANSAHDWNFPSLLSGPRVNS